MNFGLRAQKYDPDQPRVPAGSPNGGQWASGGGAGGVSLSPEARTKLDEMYGKAPQAKVEIDNLAAEVAAVYNGTVARAPVKGLKRAVEKILNDYNGDPARIKDLARNTIIVPDGKQQEALATLRQLRPDIADSDVKIATPDRDPLGYAGINVAITTRAGIRAEIQINSPAIIYGKESPDKAKTLLGPTYEQLATAPGAPAGGLGHQLYEEWRSLPPSSAKAVSLQTQSRLYYQRVREFARSRRL